MRARTWAPVALLILGGCNDAPAAGTVLLDASLESRLPASARAKLGKPTPHQKKAKLPLGARLNVTATTASTPEGGQYVTGVRVVVGDAEGWELDAALHGEPINEGKADAVRMSQSFMVTQVKRGLTGTSSGQAIVEVNSDGSLEIH